MSVKDDSAYCKPKNTTTKIFNYKESLEGSSYAPRLIQAAKTGGQKET